MELNFTATQVAIFASLEIIVIVHFKFFMMLMMDTNDLHRK